MCLYNSVFAEFFVLYNCLFDELLVRAIVLLHNVLFVRMCGWTMVDRFVCVYTRFWKQLWIITIVCLCSNYSSLFLYFAVRIIVCLYKVLLELLFSLQAFVRTRCASYKLFVAQCFARRIVCLHNESFKPLWVRTSVGSHNMLFLELRDCTRRCSWKCLFIQLSPRFMVGSWHYFVAQCVGPAIMCLYNAWFEELGVYIIDRPNSCWIVQSFACTLCCS